MSIVTIEKIIEKSKQWTLEGDCTLMEWMDQISKNLEERVNKTSSNLNDLTTNLDRTSVALSNVTNNLAALQYSQFVENRVHDDDETLANVAEVPNPVKDVTDNAPSIVSFLKINLEKMNSCHEAYSISYDDSDEDEPATNVIYRSKNPYESRALPHIYGSNLWKEKWHIGLCDSDNDFSGDENSEQFSESSSTADDSYESTAPTMSEWDSTAWGLNTNLVVERKEVHTPSNDGESSYHGEIYTHSEVSTPRRQTNLHTVQPTPDQRYYQHVSRRDDSLFDDIFTNSERPFNAQIPPQPVQQVISIAPQEKNIIQVDFVSSDPPPDVQVFESDSNRLIGAKKPVNLFDDDEFSSFMDQIVQTGTNKNMKVDKPTQEMPESPKKSALPNLFDDAEDIFIPKVSEAPQVKGEEMPPKLKDDIFIPSPLPAMSEKTGTRNLFDDDDDEDDFESMFAARPSGTKKFIMKTKNLFEDDLGDFSVEPKSQNVVSEAKKETLVKEAMVKVVPLIRQQLFEDEEDDLEREDEIFGKRAIEKDLPEEIFSDESRDDSVKNVTSLKTNLFGDTEQVKEVIEKPSKLIESTEEVNEPKPAALLKTDLFADVFRDEPPDDIFASPSSQKKTTIADIFADDFTDDFGEFIPKSPAKEEDVVGGKISPNPVITKPSTPEKLPTIAPKPKSPVIDKKNLFCDEMVSPPKDNVSSAQSKDSTANVESGDPSSTGVFKDEDIPIISPLITENPNANSNADKEPTITVPSYTSLFQDEPPPDDEDLSISSYEEPRKSTADDDNNAAYSSINLFADVPPDDDFAVTPSSETKRIHSIFYDDFHETIEASREMRAPSTYIFNEEPPPDDNLQTKVVEAKSDKPKVSKLKKTDLQINVGALLPTANIPSFKKAQSAVPTVPSPNDVDAHSKVPTIKSPKILDSPENILPNLNRDRARVQVKRRPSTRKGRQESYRKSIMEDTNVTSDKEEQTENDHRIEERSRKPKTLLEDLGTFDVNKSTAEPPALTEVLPSRTSLKQLPLRSTLFEDSDVFINKSNNSEEPKTSKTSSLFDDSDTYAGNIFETLKSNNNTVAVKTLDSLFDSDGADENPFGTPTKSLVLQSSPPQTLAKTEVIPKATSSAADSVKSAAATSTEVKLKSPIKPLPKPSSLFGESDDGSDDLFKESTVPKKLAPQKVPEIKPKTSKPVSQPVKPSSSLFSSDEENESGDDIFGKSKTKTTPRKIESVKTTTSSSLFADLSDDDDDNLFGTAKKKPSGGQKSKLKQSTTTATQSTKTPAVTPQQTATSNNPLSDLLGP